MRPKEIGIVGFDQVIASHLTGPTDAFAAAKLDDGFGGHIPCYRVWIIGLTNKPVTTESGLIFQPETTLGNAPTLDTIIVAGGSGVQRPDVAMALAEWILSRVRQTPRDRGHQQRHLRARADRSAGRTGRHYPLAPGLRSAPALSELAGRSQEAAGKRWLVLFRSRFDRRGRPRAGLG